MEIKDSDNVLTPEEHTKKVVELMEEILYSVRENKVRAAFVTLVNDEGFTFGWEIPIVHGSTMIGAIEIGKSRFTDIMKEHLPRND